MSFLQLPTEIRLQIYAQLFGGGTVHVDGGRQDIGEVEEPDMFPTNTETSRPQYRGAQLLRTCKAILFEARPVLYRHTIFRTSFQAFAGRLPVRLTSGNPSCQHIKHLEWQLNCDLLKKFSVSDVEVTAQDVRNLQTVKLTCQAENWKDSYCGAWCDRETFVRGRQQVVEFAQLLQSRMSDGKRVVTLVEDTKYLSRGRVVMRLFLGKSAKRYDVSAVVVQISESRS